MSNSSLCMDALIYVPCTVWNWSLTEVFITPLDSTRKGSDTRITSIRDVLSLVNRIGALTTLV